MIDATTQSVVALFIPQTEKEKWGKFSITHGGDEGFLDNVMIAFAAVSERGRVDQKYGFGKVGYDSMASNYMYGMQYYGGKEE